MISGLACFVQKFMANNMGGAASGLYIHLYSPYMVERNKQTYIYKQINNK